MIGNAYKTSRNIVFVLLLAVSLLWNVTTLSLGLISTAIAAAFEVVTGIKSVSAQLLTQKDEAAALRLEVSAAKRSASKWEGKAVGTALALEKEKLAKAALQTELASVRAAKRVIVDGVEMTVDEAVIRATKRVRTRTAKLAATNLSATFGQAIPWIGVSVVIAATAYELKSACDTMRDMRAIEVALKSSAQDASDVDRVCGLRVPSEEEVWQKIKASPGLAWDGAKSVLDSLPSMPSMPEFGWPSLPEIELPDAPDINWKFWE